MLVRGRSIGIVLGSAYTGNFGLYAVGHVVQSRLFKFAYKLAGVGDDEGN